jgi:hypothetical protein
MSEDPTPEKNSSESINDIQDQLFDFGNQIQNYLGNIKADLKDYKVSIEKSRAGLILEIRFKADIGMHGDDDWSNSVIRAKKMAKPKDEYRLLKAKDKEKKARRRTRGPYRKSRAIVTVKKPWTLDVKELKSFPSRGLENHCFWFFALT